MNKGDCAAQYRVESCAIERPEDIQQDWINLQDQVQCSYFQSWGWIRAWLEQIAIGLQPIVVNVWCDEQLVGLGVFVSRDIKRRVYFYSKAMFLNEYPYGERNMVIEYNGLLACKGHGEAVYEETIRYLFARDKAVDELYFGGMNDISALNEFSEKNSEYVNIICNEEADAWHVNLADLEPGLDAYLSQLSKGKRWQIRRSLRLYEQYAPLQVDEARNAVEALNFFDGLKELHTNRWQSRGLPGSFGNMKWESFHRTLINARFESGEIQLLKISNSEEVVGYLYNYVWRKRIYVLQTGFGAPEDNRLKPAYVANALAIVHNKEKGMLVYDFMIGDSHYKKQLCNSSQKLYWVVIQRRRIRFKLESLLVKMVRKGKSLLGSWSK